MSRTFQNEILHVSLLKYSNHQFVVKYSNHQFVVHTSFANFSKLFQTWNSHVPVQCLLCAPHTYNICNVPYLYVINSSHKVHIIMTHGSVVPSPLSIILRFLQGAVWWRLHEYGPVSVCVTNNNTSLSYYTRILSQPVVHAPLAAYRPIWGTTSDIYGVHRHTTIHRSRWATNNSRCTAGKGLVVNTLLPLYTMDCISWTIVSYQGYPKRIGQHLSTYRSRSFGTNRTGNTRIMKCMSLYTRTVYFKLITVDCLTHVLINSWPGLINGSRALTYRLIRGQV